MKAFESALIEAQDDGTFNVTITPVAQATEQDPSAEGESLESSEGQPISVESLDAALSEIKAVAGDEVSAEMGEGMPMEKGNPMSNMEKYLNPKG